MTERESHKKAENRTYLITSANRHRDNTPQAMTLPTQPSLSLDKIYQISHGLSTHQGQSHCPVKRSACGLLLPHNSIIITSPSFHIKSHSSHHFHLLLPMTTDKKTANAMGGKTARACDNCLHRRARWYCPADDAFLCQACDSSVHTANQLARRHERVRLQAASCKNADSVGQTSPPAWHQGFTRKARSPRNVKRKFPTPPPLVPEIGSEEASLADDSEEQFLYQVPTFDPFVAELNSHGVPEIGMENDSNPLSEYGCEEICDLDSLTGFLPSEMDLAEFAADVETYLGAGRDEDIDTLKNIKEEQVETGANFLLDTELWNLMEDEKEQEEKMVGAVEMRRKISLSLNYEDVITAWASQGSPWTAGDRPEFDPNDYWPDYMGACPANVHGACGDMGLLGRNFGGRDGGREARVFRYREKRRTRLFSKKIRYEVRKLNAEKRPRMKGRFVKRPSFAAAPCVPYLNVK